MKLLNGLLCLPLVVVICILVLKDVEAARLTITPSQNLPAGSASLTLRCSPVSNAYTKLYSIQINKRTLGQNSQTTVMAEIDGTETKPGTGITTPKYTVTGNFDADQLTQRYLQVVINNPDCNDAVEYQCITVGRATIPTNPAMLQEDKNVTVQSNPGAVEMIRFQERIRYDIGEKIEITCQGDVGNPEKFWSWESKAAGDSFFNQITVNVTKGQVDPPTSTRCGYYSRSILSFYVGQGDNGLEIRCKVDNSDQFSANKTIYLTNGSPTGNNPGENTGDDKPDNAGMIAGIVVAVIVVIVIVIVVIVVVMKRRKNTAGKDYDTQEDRMKPQTNPHMPPDTREHDHKQNNSDNGYHKNVEGLHYADLELTRAEYRKNHPEDFSSRKSSEDQSIEYASVRVS